MGGSLNYEYLGLNTGTGLYDYRVTITIYRYCEQGSSTLPTSLDLGVYQDNTLNPGGNKLLVITSNVPLITITPITPPNANDSCTFAPNVCVEEGVYQAVVSVPTNTTGYYFISDRCCRNNNIVNLANPQNDGQAYFAYAPAPTIVNSSPTFAIAPVPFICANDTVSILNQANDPDGDLLVYNFVVPYNGISNNGNPNPNPPNIYPWPITTVAYAPTYSLANPFGPGGSATIDMNTGLASYFAPNQGFYVLAVEIQEYRNGVLIGVTRRDLQIIVIPCPINPAPVLGGSNQTNYIINEGQNLCFTSTFNDPNGDSLFISHTGDIFNTILTNPAATFVDNSGLGTASGNFCWTTSCDQGRPTPYQFSVIATDNGCPAKVTNLVYSITVVNTPAPTSLTGPDTLCVNAATGIHYIVPGVIGNTFNWTISNGAVSGAQHASNVVVNFTSPGLATVSVVTVNAYGCTSDTLTKNVLILPQPTAVAGPDIQFCSGGSAVLGTSSSNGYTYSWSPTTGLSNPAISNPTVTIANSGSNPISTTYILTTTLSGCSNTDTVVVTSNPIPVATAGPDVAVCSGTAVSIGAPNVPGQTYTWSPTTGLSNSGISNPTVTFTNTSGTTDTLQYIVQVQNGAGCALTDTVLVLIYPAPVANAGPNISFCGGTGGTIGAVTINGYTYSWSPSTGLSNGTISNPFVTLTNTSGLNDTIFYTLITTLGTCSDTDVVRVIVRPSPISNAGPNQIICSGSTVQLGTGTTSGYTYSWTPPTDLNDPTISDPILTITNVGTTPDTLIYIVTTTLNTCVTQDTVQIISGPAPVANAGSNKNVCSGTSVTLGTGNVSGYSYSWTPVTGLSNGTISNPVLTLTNVSGVNDTIYYIVTTTLFSCTDMDTVRVIIRPNPVSNAGPDQLLCAGNTIQLGTSTTTGYTYSWNPSTSLNDSTIADPSLTLNNTGSTPDTLTYIVTTTLNGCITSDTVQVISGPVPVANAGSNKNVCSGTSVAIGSGNVNGYSYTWSPSTGLSNGTISNPVLTLNNVSGVNDTIYYVVTASLFGCTDQDTVRIIIRPNPVSNAGPDQLLCAGNTLQLGTISTPGYTYSWTPTTSLNDSTVSDPVLTLNNTGTTPDTLVFIVTTTLNGCVTTDSVQIVSGPAPVANAGPDVVFCSGQSALIGTAGTTGYTYSWLPSQGLSSSTDPTPTVTLTNISGVTDTVNYIITVNAYGCLDSDTILVLVNPLPISEAGANTTICGSDTIVIGTASTNGYTYSWTPASGLSATNSSNPFFVANNTGSGASVYTYTVTTTLNGCSSTDSITITVNPQPLVTATSTPVSICIGASATLNGAGAATYNWALLTTPQTSIGTGSSLNVSPTVTTSYILTGTNGFSCSGGDTVTVIVNPLPAVQITSASDSLCSGETLTLNATGATTYTWSTPGGGTIGTGTPLLVSPTVNTTYIVTGSDGNLCSNSDTINVIVNPAPTANGIIGTLSVCPSVTGVQYWITNPNPTSTYTWTITNGVVASGQGTDTITVDWSGTSGPALVSVVEVTNLGCTSITPITLAVNINVILTPVAPTGPTVFCANDASGIIYTTIGTPGSTYNWIAQGGNVVGGNGTNTVTIDWTAPGPQTVLLWYEETSTTSTNVCFGTSDTLSVTINPAPSTSAITGTANVCISDSGTFTVTNTSGSTYAWTVNGGNLISGDGTNTINVNWPTTGNATVSIIETNSYGCVGDPVTLPVVVNGLPVVDAGSNTGVCIGQSIQLNATGGVNYLWTPSTALSNTTISNPFANPTATIVYSVLVTDGNGCRNSDSVVVTVNPLPVITVTPASSVCIGSSLQLNAGGGNTYLWSPASSLDNPNSSTPFANPVVNTTYSVIVTDGNGCVDSATVAITVNALPVAVASADTLVCAGTSAYLSAGGGVSYTWTPTQGLNNSNISNPTATPSTNITYTVTVTDVNGCKDDEDVVINLNDSPTASFTVDENALSANCNGIQANLINTSQDALNYSWLFPDGTTSTEVNPVYHFDFNNTYITLIAYNNICSDTSQSNYAGSLLDDVFKDISNVFTPNGDGINDCFDLGTKYDFSDCSEMKIFNRWGSEVFHLSPGVSCWNGKKNGNGEDLPSGTYFLSVHIAGHKYNGTITLIR